jgi:hypothetical protein
MSSLNYAWFVHDSSCDHDPALAFELCAESSHHVATRTQSRVRIKMRNSRQELVRVTMALLNSAQAPSPSLLQNSLSMQPIKMSAYIRSAMPNGGACGLRISTHIGGQARHHMSP